MAVMNRLIPVSDFVLASLRHHLQATHEHYLKWYLIEAFNGASLVTPQGNLEVLFFLDKQEQKRVTEKATNTIYCELDDIIVSVFSHPGTPSPSLCDVMVAAYQQAITLESEYPQWMRRLRLVQIQCLFEASAKTTERVAEEIAGEIGLLLGSRAMVASPHPGFGESQFFSDIGFPLPESLSVPESLERLTAYFPNIASSPAGLNAVVINHQGGECIDSRVKWAHVYGRHFYMPFEYLG